MNCVTMFAMRVGGHALAVSFHFTGSPPGSLCTTGVLATAYLGRHGMDRFDCCICRHSCQLAAVVCNCSKERVACLRHFSQVQMCVGIVANSAASPRFCPTSCATAPTPRNASCPTAASQPWTPSSSASRGDAGSCSAALPYVGSHGATLRSRSLMGAVPTARGCSPPVQQEAAATP